MHDKEFLNAKETADYLGLKNGKSVLYAWKNRKIPGTKINNKFMVSKRQLVDHIEKMSLENYQEPKRKTDSAFYRKEMQMMERKKRVGA